MSDGEDSQFFLEELFDNNRADSPDSLPPHVEARHLAASSPLLSAARPLTYTDDVQDSARDNPPNSFSTENVASLKFQKNFTQLNFASSDSSSTSYELTLTKEHHVRHKSCINNLMSHLYDPVYKGKCSCCDAPFSENT